MSKNKTKSKIPYIHRLSTKLSLSFLIGVILITFISTSVLFFLSYNMLVNELRTQSKNLSTKAAEVIDIDKFTELKTIDDEQTQIYDDMREKLNDIRKLTGAEYVYTMRKSENGDFTYVVDGADKGDVSHIGDTEESYIGYEKVYEGEVYTNKNIEFTEEWGATISSYYPLKDNGGNVVGFVGVDYDATEVYNDLNKLRLTSIIILIIISIFSLGFGILISRKISKPIQMIAERSDRVANYDLDADKISLKTKSEVGLLANSFNTMVSNMKNVLEQVKDSGDSVATTSISLNETISQTTTAVSEVSKTIEEIAVGTNDQAKDIEKGVQEIDNLANVIGDVADSARVMESTSNETKKLSNKGLDIVDILIKKTTESNNAAKEINNIIVAVNGDSKRINNITETINGIAEQTNLLALNASIEAARAGEAGKGFAVVADEIRKLAEESAIAVTEIRDIADGMHKNSGGAVETMKQVGGIVGEQNKSVEDTEKVFKEISYSINDLIDKIDNIKASIEGMDNNKNKIVSMMENISAVSEETSAATQQVSASTEEQLASMEEVNSYSEELSRLSNEFKSIIETFKI